MGAAQRPECADAHQAFYTGYCKYHGVKIESGFTPDGLSHILGPLSARPADASVLQTSNLSNFLLLIQRGLWTAVADAGIIFSVFGDGAYNLGLPCISSYFRSFVGGVELTADEDFCNMHARSARVTRSRRIVEWLVTYFTFATCKMQIS